MPTWVSTSHSVGRELLHTDRKTGNTPEPTKSNNKGNDDEDDDDDDAVKIKCFLHRI